MMAITVPTVAHTIVAGRIGRVAATTRLSHRGVGVFADRGATSAMPHNSALSMPLRSSAGELLGYLNWQARLPGAQAARAASSDITQIVVLASALILLFILVSSVGLYNVRSG